MDGLPGTVPAHSGNSAQDMASEGPGDPLEKAGERSPADVKTGQARLVGRGLRSEDLGPSRGCPGAPGFVLQ